MKVSICIATYNTLELTRQCFESLLQHTHEMEYEVVVVDDMSSDGTREYLKTLDKPFRVILNETRKGFAANNNIAAREAEGEVLVLLNCDTILNKEWLPPLLNGLEQGRDIGFVGNVQWSPRTGRYDHMGMVVGDDLIPAHFGRYWRFVPFRGYKEWVSVTAACCAIRKDVFTKVGGFDESYANGCEDVDMCLKLGKEGYRHLVAYESRISHYVSSSPGRNDRIKQNEELLLSRWKDVLVSQRNQQEIRLAGLNYIGRFLDRPWKYNGAKLLNSFKKLI